MEYVTSAYAEFLNIKNAVEYHRQHCGESCNVSLSMLSWTAKRLIADMRDVEKVRALEALKESIWY